MSAVVQRPRLDAVAVSVMLVLCTVWGVQQVASKVALAQGMPPFLQAALRSLLAGPALLGWVWLRRGRPGLAELVRADGSLWPGLGIGVLFAVEFMLLFSGVQRTSASHGVVLLFSGGFVTAGGAHLLIPGERLRPGQWAGFVLAFAGVVATMIEGVGGGGAVSVGGDLLVVGAAVCWGATTLAVKVSPALRRLSAEKVLAYQLWGALPFILLGTAVVGELRVPVASGLAWASLLYQGLVVAFASYLAWFWLVTRYPAGRLAAFSFLTPVLGVGAAAVLLGDAVSVSLGVGLGLVCLGLRLVNG